MRKITRSIPNTLTSLNLFSGCVACYFAYNHQFKFTFLFILLSALFDFCDGMVARLLKTSSPIGKELDSLADDISFGFVPATIVFCLMSSSTDNFIQWPTWLYNIRSFIPFSAYLIAIFSALRLAKFNVDSRQLHSFIGLPTPANTLFWISFVWGVPLYIHSLNVFILLIMISLSSLLLVAEIPMFSLKFENLKWKNNKIRYIFLLTCLPLFLLKELSLAAIILWYIILSIITIKKEN